MWGEGWKILQKSLKRQGIENGGKDRATLTVFSEIERDLYKYLFWSKFVEHSLTKPLFQMMISRNNKKVL